MKKIRGDRRLLTLLAILLAMPLVSRVLMAKIPVLHRLELLVYDWHCSSLPVQRPDPRIVYIGMDDASLDHLPGSGGAYPLPRWMQGHLVDELRAAKARAIGFDMWLTRPQGAIRGKTGPDGKPIDDDAVFSAALHRQAQTGRKVVAALESHLHTVALHDGTQVEQVDFAAPAPRLRPWLLPASILVSRQFYRVRSFQLYPRDDATGERYLNLALALGATFRGLQNEKPVITDDPYTFHLGDINLPVAPSVGGEGEVEALIRFAGPPGTFIPIPYYQVFNGDWKRLYGADFFRGKIVLIGMKDQHEDRQDTPWGDTQGTEILANEIQTVIQDERQVHWSEAENYALKLLLCALLVGVVLRTGLRFAFGVVLTECVAWIVFAHMLFLRTGVWADTVEPIGALMATYLLVAAVETRRMRMVFHRFLPSAVAERMLRADAAQAVRTAEREATVVFCDVRDFTVIAEHLSSEALEALLHRYFLAGEDIARPLGAEIDKFVGDEIMLYFVDPAPSLFPFARSHTEGHALRAVRWALAMQREAARIDAEGLTGGAGIAGAVGFRIGIGIETGMVRRGVVGARRLQHTVIGDAVNTASRLEGVTKEVAHGIIMGEATWRAVGAAVESEALGEVKLRGKAQPLAVYCPLRVV